MDKKNPLLILSFGPAGYGLGMFTGEAWPWPAGDPLWLSLPIAWVALAVFLYRREIIDYSRSIRFLKVSNLVASVDIKYLIKSIVFFALVIVLIPLYAANNLEFIQPAIRVLYTIFGSLMICSFVFGLVSGKKPSFRDEFQLIVGVLMVTNHLMIEELMRSGP